MNKPANTLIPNEATKFQCRPFSSEDFYHIWSSAYIFSSPVHGTLHFEVLRSDFTSKLEHGLAFGTPKFYIVPYDKINRALVNLSYNRDVKSGQNYQKTAQGTCKVSGRSVVFSAFYADFCLCPKSVIIKVDDG